MERRRMIKKFLLIFGACSLAFTAFTFGAIQLDLCANAWIREAAKDWQWYNYLTSSHSLTVSYLKGNPMWLVVSLICSSLLSVIVFFWSEAGRIDR